MAKSSGLNFNLPSVDDLFSTEEERAEARLEKIVNLSPAEISDFPNHPFKVRMDEAMQEMTESVKQYGVLVPTLVRPKPEGGYEMVAGHRRKKAADLAGLAEIPCIVRQLTDDEATIIMVDSNLQREQILPSEKAFAYKMKLDAIIDVCTRMTGPDAVLLGQYRGFSMVLAYDGRSNEYRITLKGTLSHTVTLGADVFGNITRLDNALENLAGSLQAEQNSLEETKTQLENARTELAAPFAREEELAEKTARLKELNILLNMDEKDKTLLDDTPDEGEDVPARRVAELAR